MTQDKQALRAALAAIQQGDDTSSYAELSRVLRSTELRVRGVEADRLAIEFIQQAAANCSAIRIIANRPDRGTYEELSGPADRMAVRFTGACLHGTGSLWRDEAGVWWLEFA